MATWALDLDGVLWRGEVPVPGSADAVARLRDRGDRVAFVTNDSSATLAAHRAKLRRMGVAAGPDDVLTSAAAAARLLAPGTSALVLAGDGVREALAARGVREVAEGPADAVVVGWHQGFDFAGLTRAADAVRAGARLVGTNADPSRPAPGGLLPGAGAILAAVAVAAGAEPELAGKPHPPMADLVRERLGRVDVVVGDRPSTDGLLARRLGARFALVRSGVTTDPAGSDPAPDATAPDLAALVRAGGPASA